MLFHMQSKEVPGSVISYLYVLLQMFQQGYLKKYASAMGDKYSVKDSYFEKELKAGKRVLQHTSQRRYIYLQAADPIALWAFSLPLFL